MILKTIFWFMWTLFIWVVSGSYWYQVGLADKKDSVGDVPFELLLEDSEDD